MRTPKLVLVGGMVLVLAMAGTATANTLWGTSHGTSGFWTGGSIWTFDTTTSALTVKHTYSSAQLFAFGDIAVSPAGEVYVTYYGQDGFDKLAKVNTSTWDFDWVHDLGGSSDQVNALEFIGSELYGVTGGGIDAHLLKFALPGGGATVTDLGKIGINSDGDLSRDPLTGDVYYTSWETGNQSQLNTVDLTVPSETLVAYITPSNGWAGLAFTLDGTLWAGNYWLNDLYTLDKSTGVATFVSDLPGVGSVTGLSVPVPEPVTMAGMLMAVGGLAGYIRRRRTA